MPVDFGGSGSRRVFAERILREARAQAAGGVVDLSPSIAGLPVASSVTASDSFPFITTSGNGYRGTASLIRDYALGISGGTATIPENLTVSGTLTANGAVVARGLLTVYPTGATSPRTNWGAATANSLIAASSVTGESITFIRGDNGTTAGAEIRLLRTGNADPGILSSVATFDTLGAFTFGGVTTSGAVVISAHISANVEASPTSTALPTDIHIRTMNTGDTSAIRRWSFRRDGHLVPSEFPNAHNLYDLGLTTHRVRTGYFGTSVLVGSTTINSTSATMGGSLTVTTNLVVNGNTTIGNATSDTLTVTARLGSGLTWATDNSLDIGASGANRPRRGYFGTEVLAPTVTATSLGGTLTTASQPNVTTVGTLLALAVSGDTALGGDVTFAGPWQHPDVIAGTFTIAANHRGALLGPVGVSGTIDVAGTLAILA